MTRHRSLQRQPRQQEARTRGASFYHHPLQLGASTNAILNISDEGSVTDNNKIPRGLGDSRPPPLSLAKKKQLLQDIEENGWLHVFSLSQLRQARPQFYDEPDYILRQVQNYVDHIRNYDDRRYLLLLSQYNVLASSRLSHFFSPESASQPSTPQTPALPLQTADSQPTPALPEATFAASPERHNRRSTFASPSRSSVPRFVSPMSSVASSSNALALRPGNHDEVEGMCHES
jgi:hypothetical protein